MYTLYKIDHLRDYGTVDDVVKTTYMWIDEDSENDFSDWAADGMTYTKRLLTVQQFRDIEAINDACMKEIEDYYEPDAVLTSQGWRCDV